MVALNGFYYLPTLVSDNECQGKNGRSVRMVDFLPTYVGRCIGAGWNGFYYLPTLDKVEEPSVEWIFYLSTWVGHPRIVTDIVKDPV